MAYNPYGFYNPYQQQQKPINPRDLADQFAKSQQQYMNAYNQYQQAAQNIKTPPIANPNAGVPNAAPNPSTAPQNSLSTFNGIYVDSYEDVKKAPVALDGTATICIGDGAFWIKKNVEGTITIDKRVYSEETKENEAETDISERLSILETKVNSLLNKKEVKNNEKQHNTNSNVNKKSKSTKE